MKVLALVLILIAAVCAPAQDALRDMNKLNWLVGSWKGKGSIVLGPNEKKNFLQVEDVRQKLGGVIITIDGLGVDSEDQTKVVHEAFGVISYDPAKKAYNFKPYLSDGRTVDAKVTVTDKQFQWSMDAGEGVQIRYTIAITEKGEWHEIGEMSRDKGKDYFKFFEMTLEKVAE